MGYAADRTEMARARIVKEWQGSGARVKQVAASLAIEFRNAPARTLVESSTRIATRFRTSNSTATRARKLLLDTGFVTRSDDHHYYVA